MSWLEQIQALPEEQLRDLMSYLYGSRYQNSDLETLQQTLLHGKKRCFFYLCDKQAYKTLKRLIRHPDRSIHLQRYPIEQLLQLGMAEEIPSLHREKNIGWYQIRDEALPFAKSVFKIRHYDRLVFNLQRQDDILLGLFHSYGLLELHQCCNMMAQYGIDIDSEQLFLSITWRLPRSEYLQGFQLHQHGKVASFIMLRGLDFISAYQGIRMHAGVPYAVCEEQEMRKRKHRYYAMETAPMLALKQYLIKAFSRQYALAVLREFIDAFQYHTCEFTYEKTLYRVFGEAEMKPYLEAAMTALPDIYLKAHSADEIFDIGNGE